MSQIPTLDIRRFSKSNSSGERGAFVAELGAAYREWGFAGIRNHGISQQLIDDAYDAFRRCFALPEETKRKYHVPGSGGARGYTPFGIETAHSPSLSWSYGHGPLESCLGGSGQPDRLARSLPLHDQPPARQVHVHFLAEQPVPPADRNRATGASTVGAS